MLILSRNKMNTPITKNAMTARMIRKSPENAATGSKSATANPSHFSHEDSSLNIILLYSNTAPRIIKVIKPANNPSEPYNITENNIGTAIIPVIHLFI
jgi:hypothetical protein